MGNFAKILNPKIRGWINYYTRFYKHETLQVFCYLNGLIRKWLKNKCLLVNHKQVTAKYKALQQLNPVLFYHWSLGLNKI